MARETTNLGRLGGLQKFRTALNNNSGALPHLDVSRAQYEDLVGKASDLANRQSALTAEKQDSSKQFAGALTEAERLGTVLRLAVKQHFGIDAEKLVEFNIQPFRGRKKKSPPPTTPPVNPTEYFPLTGGVRRACPRLSSSARSFCCPAEAGDLPPQASLALRNLLSAAASFCGATEASMRHRKLLWADRSFCGRPQVSVACRKLLRRSAGFRRPAEACGPPPQASLARRKLLYAAISFCAAL